MDTEVQGREAASEARIMELAGTQHGIVTRQQLLGAGLTRRVVARRVQQLRLRPIHRGVYLIGAVMPTWALEMAALLACGTRAVLSHWTAARVWALVQQDPTGEQLVDVIVPLTGSGDRAGVRVHRTAALHPSEVRRLHGMPVTAPARTVFDLAAPLGRTGETRRLEQLVAELLDRRLATEGELHEVVARHASHKGAGLLRLLLADRAGLALARSAAEEQLLVLIRPTGLPLPRLNARAAGFEVDFLWPAERLIVEVDGYAWHSSRNRFEGDRARDLALTAAGYTVLRVTWRQITAEPQAVVARIAYMLGRLGARQPTQ